MGGSNIDWGVSLVQISFKSWGYYLGGGGGSIPLVRQYIDNLSIMTE